MVSSLLQKAFPAIHPERALDRLGRFAEFRAAYNRARLRQNRPRGPRSGWPIEVCDGQIIDGHFRFKHAGQDANDLAVVAVHLASGQRNNRNHDRAMEMLRAELQAAREQGWCIPSDENDIAIMGDFNTNRFDNVAEDFWDEMEGDGWDVLGDIMDQYPPTRLSGVPLRLDRSRIDYIIVTQGNHGLAGEEVTAAQAFVHEGLINGNAERFRRRASDHLPVTVRVKVMADTDGGL